MSKTVLCTNCGHKKKLDAESEDDFLMQKEFRKQDLARENGTHRDTECKHYYWMKKCSICTVILESDTQVNYVVGENMKVVYSDFDSVVCSYASATRLKKIKVKQRSKLYWVYNTESNVLSIKSKENVSLKGTVIASAFTSSELCRYFYRLPKEKQTPALFEEIGRLCYEPTAVANILFRELR